MDLPENGLKSTDLTFYATQVASDLSFLNQTGLSTAAQVLFAKLRAALETYVQEDIRKDGNPAVTAWRLDQFNDWFQAELKVADGTGQKTHCPRFVLGDPSLFGDRVTVER